MASLYSVSWTETSCVGSFVGSRGQAGARLWNNDAAASAILIIRVFLSNFRAQVQPELTWCKARFPIELPVSVVELDV